MTTLFILFSIENKIPNMACSFLPLLVLLFFSLISHIFHQLSILLELILLFFWTTYFLCINRFPPVTSWFSSFFFSIRCSVKNITFLWTHSQLNAGQITFLTLCFYICLCISSIILWQCVIIQLYHHLLFPVTPIFCKPSAS